MKMLNRKNDSPYSTPISGVTGAQAAETSERGVKLNKKGHTVKFKDSIPDGGALEAIKEFKEEPYEMENPFWYRANEVR